MCEACPTGGGSRQRNVSRAKGVRLDGSRQEQVSKGVRGFAEQVDGRRKPLIRFAEVVQYCIEQRLGSRTSSWHRPDTCMLRLHDRA